MRIFKIYGLVDPISNELKYIGQTVSCLKQRLRAHISEKKNYKKTKWIKLLMDKKIRPLIITIDECKTVDESNELEVFWISYFKSIGCNLTNVYSGGKSYDKTAEHKKKISEKMKSIWAEGRSIHPHTIESLKRMASERVGKPANKETYLKIAISNTGKKRTPDQIEKLRKIKLGTTSSEETKKRISVALSGRTLSEEHKRNLSKPKKRI